MNREIVKSFPFFCAFFLEKKLLSFRFVTTMTNNEILVFGSVAYDCIETPFAHADYILGGSASYAALASSFFAPTKIVSKVGSDFKEDDLKRLQNKNIDTSFIEIDESKSTFFWRGKYHENFNNRDTLEVRTSIYDDYIPKFECDESTSPYVLLANTSPQTQSKFLDLIQNPTFVVLDSMNLWIEIANKELRELIKRVDLLILNDSEAKQLTGESNLIVCGDILRSSFDAKSVIIKKGEHGAILFHKDGMFSIPSYPVHELFDPTGAGDSFAGALIGHLAQCGDTSFESIRQAMLTATAVASLTVESFSCDKLENAGLSEIDSRKNFIRNFTRL